MGVPPPEYIRRWLPRATRRRAQILEEGHKSILGYLFWMINSMGRHYWVRGLKSMRSGILVGGHGEMIFRVDIAEVPEDASP